MVEITKQMIEKVYKKRHISFITIKKMLLENNGDVDIVVNLIKKDGNVQQICQHRKRDETNN